VAARALRRPAAAGGGRRALANEPPLLLADEPTGQLDSGTGQSIMALIRATVDERGTTALVTTHDSAVLEVADRVLTLQDGQLVA
jgi:putative ABC transport system ATP-binding protein